jgi:hypothetical protein
MSFVLDLYPTLCEWSETTRQFTPGSVKRMRAIMPFHPYGAISGRFRADNEGIGFAPNFLGRLCTGQPGEVAWRQIESFSILPLGLVNFSRLEFVTKDSGLLVFGFQGVSKRPAERLLALEREQKGLGDT